MDFPDGFLFLVLLILSISATFSDENNNLLTKCDENGVLQITGKVIKTSNININECKKKIKLLKIFAEEIVKIDEDLNFSGQEIQVVIIAPIWEIIENRKINLDGQNADNHKDVVAYHANKSGNRNGVDGLAGLPGGPAGNFYGIANEIKNAHKLSISANGGRGGNGQNGENGKNGKDGKSPPRDIYDCDTNKAPGFKVEQWKGVIYIVGDYGECGGRGGHGGAKGLGGHSGIIEIIEISKYNDSSSVVKLMNIGSSGDDGIGGIGGTGGKPGEEHKGYCANVWGSVSFKYYKRLKYNDLSRAKGFNGDSGKSFKQRQIPKPSVIIENFSQIINEYKNYIRPKLANPNNRNSKMHSLYESLNSRREITKLYDSVNLVDEFTDLELEYFTSEDRDYLLPSYTQLTRRFDEYVMSINSDHFDERTKKIYKEVVMELNWLLKKRLNSYNTPKGHFVMTNITQGLTSNGIKPKNTLVEHANNYIRLEAFSYRISEIDYLIREANEFINNDLQNAVQDLQNTLDSKINNVLEEISTLVKKYLYLEDDLVNKRQELKNAMYLKGVLSVLKAGCGIAAAVYPPLGVAAAVGSSALSVAESLIPDVDASSQIKKVTKAKKMLSKASKKFLLNIDVSNQEIFLNSRITEMTVNMSSSGKDAVEQLKNKIIKQLKKADDDEEEKSKKSFEWDKSYIDDVTKELEEAAKEGNKAKETDCMTKLSVIKLLKVSNIVMSTASSTLKNNLADKKKLDEIDDALESNKENLKNLYVIEEGIYTQTEPMLENMFSDIHQMGRNMSRMSVNQKLIANWNVSNTLEEVQQKINSTLSTFEASDDINFTFKKLFSTFKVITQLHDVITRKLDEKSDVTFLVTLHMPQHTKSLAVNSKLAWSLAKFNKIFYQNNLLDKYNEWIYAFKQFSFPNGGQYLLETNYPNRTQAESIDNFVIGIQQNIDTFNEYFNTEYGMDQFLVDQLVESYRGTCSNNKRAFFVWGKKDYNNTITDILKGNKVKVMSKRIHSETDSLKFNNIGIIFTSQDATVQEKLFNVLSNFKVNLTHNGDSVYSFSNKNYVIQTNPVDLIFDYPARVNEIVGLSSPMHKKFASGDCILSPFATWTVQLLPTGKNDFELLEKFIGKVDLELIGEGQRFKSNGCDEMCQTLVDNTYKLSV